MRLVLWCGPDGCVRDFDLVPANAPEREAVLELLERQPPAGQLVVADKGFASREFEAAVAELGGLLLRPKRANEPDRPSPPIGRIRQRIESIVNSLKDQLRLEYHLAKTPTGLTCRIAARILALTAAIHLNWQLGQPARALTTYGH
jgi:Transposase DDE domain